MHIPTNIGISGRLKDIYSNSSIKFVVRREAFLEDLILWSVSSKFDDFFDFFVELSYNMMYLFDFFGLFIQFVLEIVVHLFFSIFLLDFTDESFSGVED